MSTELSIFTPMLSKDDIEQLFPSCDDFITDLIKQYELHKNHIVSFGKLMAESGNNTALEYFQRAHAKENEGTYTYWSLATENVHSMYTDTGIAKAIKYLDAVFWEQAFSKTDVRESMPQNRREEWNKQIKDLNVPEFTESNVRHTLFDLLNSRFKFFCEKVDNLFRCLSRDHVTNQPEGFSKRMIFNYMVRDGWNIDYERCRLLDDMRQVIGKLFKDDLSLNEKYYEFRTNEIIKTMYSMSQTGQWNEIDGGLLKIRVYKKGTLHLEVHPDIAWKLNCLLASLYPAAIPSEFRTKTKKPVKEFTILEKMLNASTRNLLIDTNKYNFGYDAAKEQFIVKKNDNQELIQVLLQLGGVWSQTRIVIQRSGYNTWYGDADCIQFDYDVGNVLKEVALKGFVPDYKSYQFYPTPDNIAQFAVEWADIKNGEDKLEPSAGIGNIAKYMGYDTTCVELSEIHCKALTEQGFTKVICDDFILHNGEYDVIVMNPPFSEGRVQAHILHAFGLLRNGGRLVAVLPASYKGKNFVGKCASIEYSDIFKNEFDKTSIDTICVKIVK